MIEERFCHVPTLEGKLVVVLRAGGRCDRGTGATRNIINGLRLGTWCCTVMTSKMAGVGRNGETKQSYFAVCTELLRPSVE